MGRRETPHFSFFYHPFLTIRNSLRASPSTGTRTDEKRPCHQHFFHTNRPMERYRGVGELQLPGSSAKGLGHDAAHRGVVGLHAFKQAALGAGAHKVVVGIADFIICVAVDVVHQEAEHLLEGDVAG